MTNGFPDQEEEEEEEKFSESSSSVLEELAADSTGNGLEAELEQDEDSEIRAPFDPTLIDVITHQRTVDLLMSRLEHGEINLSPDFQRRANIWKEPRKSGLVESMLLRIPIPSLYVSEDKDGNYEVVDGLQRLCAIAHFVKVSSLNKSLGTKLNPLRLTGLQSLRSELDAKTFDELPRALQRRIRETELTLHVIRAGTPLNVKFNIFSRINQGGLPLRAQEIRNAIYPGRWRDHTRRMAGSAEFFKATEGRIKGERLEDFELVLRFAALFSFRNRSRPNQENLDDFLNDFVEKRSANWDEKDWKTVEEAFVRAVTAAPRIFDKIAFRKYSSPHVSRHPINRGLFESQVTAIAWRTDAEIDKLIENSAQVLKLFAKQESDFDFNNSLLYATGRGKSSNKRLETINKIFDEVLNA
jgi:hypothetical protein